MSETQTSQENAVVVPKYDQLTDKINQIYNFKKDKLGNKRSSVEIPTPVPSVEGIVAILQEGGKKLELLQDVLADYIRGAVGEWVGDNADASAENFKANDFSWEALANKPKQDRRQVTITPEQWAAFFEDYKKVMSVASKKTEEQLDNACKVYGAKFAMFKTDKKTLEALKGQLTIYADATESGDEHVEILDLLLRRLETYLKADDPAALAAAL
jgi:hypothetical protein